MNSSYGAGWFDYAPSIMEAWNPLAWVEAGYKTDRDARMSDERIIEQINFVPTGMAAPGVQQGYTTNAPVPQYPGYVGEGLIGTAAATGQGPQTTQGQLQQIAHWMAQTGKSPEEAAQVFGVPAGKIRSGLKLGPAPWQIALFAGLTVGIPLLIFGGLAAKNRGGRRRRR